MKRYALIYHGSSEEQIARYLPANYEIVCEVPTDTEGLPLRAAALGRKSGHIHLIEGRDNAGWTLDGYVLPRLASGLHFGEEISLDHPVFKSIPIPETAAR